MLINRVLTVCVGIDRTYQHGSSNLAGYLVVIYFVKVFNVYLLEDKKRISFFPKLDMTEPENSL